MNDGKHSPGNPLVDSNHAASEDPASSANDVDSNETELSPASVLKESELSDEREVPARQGEDSETRFLLMFLAIMTISLVAVFLLVICLNGI